MVTRRASLAVLLLAALAPVAALLGAAPAVAAPESPDGTAGEVLVIMDVSGSMARKDAGGTTLIRGARQAIDRLVGESPPEARVGLRFYGSEYAGDAKAAGCRDTELAVPVGPISETGDDIRAAIRDAEPTGFTPIGHALEQAAGDFAAEGPRSIVLVSDGEDTCNDPPPCKAAKDLAAQGIDVRIDTVGLFLQDAPKARKQLTCIAEATGGKFHPARDAAALGEQLTAVSTRAIERFRAAGTEVDGGPAATRATPVETGQSYTDDVGFGEARWYSFEGEAGQKVTVTLTEPGTTRYGCCLYLRLVDPELDATDSENHYNSDGTARSYRISSSNQYAPDRGIPTSGTYYVAVELEDTTSEESEKQGLVGYEFTIEVEDTASSSASPSASASPSESAPASPTASPSEPATTPVATDADDGGNGLLWTIIALLGALVVGLAAAVALLFRRLSAGASGSAPPPGSNDPAP